MAPIIEWMLAGLPQMCANELAFMQAPVVLQLDGAGGGSFIMNTTQPVNSRIVWILNAVPDQR